MQTGLVGHLDLPDSVRIERIQAAHDEVLGIADLMECEAINVQIGLIDDAMLASTFQILTREHHSVWAVSPFRFCELPNIRNGIATITASPDAVRMYNQMIVGLWASAQKGKSAAQYLRRLVERM